MTKKATLVNQADNAGATKPEEYVRQVSIQKLYRDHKFCDHSHGRVNKNPIGINHEPGIF
ncbi:MAG: hypothetical protein JWP94_3653 [Mucilaginibacter sp.]|nr:hypothetical protein [Mucilaginibacter sp.]